MNVNQAAFCTATPLAVGTIYSTFAAATAATTVATIAYTVLATLGAALSIAALTAWVACKSSENEQDASAYFQKFTSHIGYTVVGTVHFVAQTLFLSLIRGLSEGISGLISGKISGRRTA